MSGGRYLVSIFGVVVSAKSAQFTLVLTLISLLHCRSVPVLLCGGHVLVIALSHQLQCHYASVC